MIANFGFGDEQSSWAGTFFSPSSVLIAERLDEVVPLIVRAEHEAHAGNFVAMMLSYEAAPAFDTALVTHNATRLPLAWAAVFPEFKITSMGEEKNYSLSQWTPGVTRSEYNQAIAQIHELIARGDTYQVNYCFSLNATFTGNPLAFYRQLSVAQGAPFSAFLDLGRYKVLSLSPELFFERTGDVVRARPMKGTIRRGRWTSEDQLLAEELSSSQKDRAENVMIVDLLRNDLGKVSIPGTVAVTSLFELERFETVWQMTSTIQSQLQPATSLAQLLTALFPCGSITGAPKIRTMQIIRQLESRERGAYTGTIGLIRPGGDCVFNVAIRTVVIDSENEQATFGVGGGITIDSTAENEYEECLVKARFLNVSPRSFDLFESILLEDGSLFLLERHLQRLRESADYFGFEFSEQRAAEELEKVRNNTPTDKWKVRLLLTKTGEISTDIKRLSPVNIFKVGLAASPVDSSDRLLFHKTTSRGSYDAQLAARPECDDLIFFNERDELTESTIANVVVKLSGRLYTPPVSAGLLAGTFRNQLLADGEIEERTIRIEEIEEAEAVFLINSVRKWIQVEVV